MGFKDGVVYGANLSSAYRGMLVTDGEAHAGGMKIRALLWTGVVGQCDLTCYSCRWHVSSQCRKISVSVRGWINRLSPS